MWKVFIIENGKEKLIYNGRWMPTSDNMEIVCKVRGKKYRVVSPQGKDCTSSFRYGKET